jgi:predicted esterase
MTDVTMSEALPCLPRTCRPFARPATAALLFLGCSLPMPLNAQANDWFPLCARSATAGYPVVKRTTLAGVPAILRIPEHIRRPPIVLWHGFGPPASEEAMMDGLPLDEVDAVKVYLGLPLFGARALAGGMKELARRQSEDVGLQVFKPVVVGAGNELPGVVAALQRGACMRRDGAISLIGFSAGGAAVLYSLAQGSVRVDAAVLINPSTGLSESVKAYERATKRTYAWSPASRELAQETDAAVRAADIARARPALLFLSGKDDLVVDSDAISEVYEKLKSYYGKDDSRLQWKVMPAIPHQWAADPQSVASVRKAAAEWLTDFSTSP